MSILDPDQLPQDPPPLTTTLPSVPPRAWEVGVVPDPERFAPGDIVLFQPKVPGFFQKRIQAVQRALGLNPANCLWTHAAIHIGNFTIVEATVKKGIRVSHLLERCYGNDRIMVRRLANFAGLQDALGRPFTTALEVQQRIALEAAVRLGEKYRKWDGVKWGYYSLFPDFYRSKIEQISGPGAVCSTLVSDALYQAVDVVVSPQAYPRRPTFPADLAQSTALQEVDLRWVKLQS